MQKDTIHNIDNIEHKQNNTDSDKKWIWLIGILYGGGIIAHNNSFLFAITQQITDGLLLFTNGIVLYSLAQQAKHKQPNKRFLLLGTCAVLAIATFMIEVLGVATGKVFGAYEYGATMKLQLWNVPLVIGLNWVILMLGGLDFAGKLIPKKSNIFAKTITILTRALIAASLVLFFDWVMEPVAIKLDYWHWFGQEIPLQNYAAWFVIAFIMSLVVQFLGIQTESRLLRWYFVVQLIFFVLLRVLL